MNDLIRKAAEKVGWQWSSSVAKNSADYPGEIVEWRDQWGQHWKPTKDRTHLHALCGLLEDVVREKWPQIHIQCYLSAKQDGITNLFVANAGSQSARNRDWLLAKLEFLVRVSDE